jgi:hypothetical protein
MYDRKYACSKSIEVIIYESKSFHEVGRRSECGGCGKSHSAGNGGPGTEASGDHPG